MQYGKGRPINPSNMGRQHYARNISVPYEQAARKQTTNAIEAAQYEVTYYSRITHGTPCSCSHRTRVDPLNALGEMNVETMGVVLDGPDPDMHEQDGGGRRFKMMDYALKNPEPVTPPSSPVIIEDGLTEDDDFIDDEFDDMSPEHLLNAGPLLASYGPYSANCGVCNRTGFVGGFNRVGGWRKVWSPMDLQEAALNGMRPNAGNIPNTFDVTNDEGGAVHFTATLPRNPYSVGTIGLLNNHERFRLGVDWWLEVDGVAITSPHVLKTFCTGDAVAITVRSMHHWTHFELEMVLQANPLIVDLSGLHRATTSQSLNDFDVLTVNIPPRVPVVQRGDLLFDKTTRLGWVVTAGETLRTANMQHGHTPQITRINDRADGFSVQNPYLAGSGISFNSRS